MVHRFPLKGSFKGDIDMDIDSYHHRDIRLILWFWEYGNLIRVPQQQPSRWLRFWGASGNGSVRCTVDVHISIYIYTCTYTHTSTHTYAYTYV